MPTPRRPAKRRRAREEGIHEHPIRFRPPIDSIDARVQRCRRDGCVLFLRNEVTAGCWNTVHSPVAVSPAPDAAWIRSDEIRTLSVRGILGLASSYGLSSQIIGLAKCASKIQQYGLTNTEIPRGATDIVWFIFDSPAYRLEAPVRVIDEDGAS